MNYLLFYVIPYKFVQFLPLIPCAGVERAIYMDVDTIVQGDLVSLWKTDLTVGIFQQRIEFSVIFVLMGKTFKAKSLGSTWNSTARRCLSECAAKILN